MTSSRKGIGVHFLEGLGVPWRAGLFFGGNLGKQEARRAESFLTAWANLPGTWPQYAEPNFRPALDRLIQQYTEFVVGQGTADLSATERAKTFLMEFLPLLRMGWGGKHEQLLFSRIRIEYPQRVGRMFPNLANIESPTLVDGIAYASKVTPRRGVGIPYPSEMDQKAIEHAIVEETHSYLSEYLTPDSHFDRAMVHLERVATRAKMCRNRDCPARLFIASKKGQMYCSPKCAAQVTREKKRIWWEQNRGKQESKQGGPHGTHKAR